MREDIGYEEFLVAIYEAEIEGSKGKIVSAKAKALNVEKVSENRESVELKDFKDPKQQIELLPMIMKGATVGNIKPQIGYGPLPKEKGSVW